MKKLLDVSDVLLQPLGGDLVNKLGHVAQKIPVVGHDHQRAVESFQRLLQDGLALQVQVVGRLVKDQDIVGVEEKLAKGEPCLLAS